jgi:hypothetical protein
VIVVSGMGLFMGCEFVLPIKVLSQPGWSHSNGLTGVLDVCESETQEDCVKTRAVTYGFAFLTGFVFISI